MITISMPNIQKINSDLQSAQAALKSPRPLLAAAAKAVQVLLRAHFLNRNATPNAKGWPRKNFWNRIRRATAIESITDTEAVIAIADPAINQKVYGGKITPKRGRYLAIPAIPEAYRAGSPRELNSDFLRLGFGRNGPNSLVERPATQIRRTKKGYKAVASVGGRVWYFLVKSVNQAPDLNALPSDQAMLEAASNAVQTALLTPLS